MDENKKRGGNDMFRKKILVGSITATLLLTSGISVALADTNLDDFNVEPFGTTWQSFALTVPGNNVNDSRGETPSQTKTNAFADAGLRIHSTGGASLDVRTESSSTNGSWRYGVTSSNTYALNSPHQAGSTVWLQFSTGLFQGPVPITGDWRSN
ncbi:MULTISPECIES: hypothetical protein [Paenibacillus]|uniref:hypothetical protein n=1 Tax=Paenibacillus TaxID=44249 RepID=UPI001140A7AA|nr:MULTISPECIES: hypothetical protein [Paenibacillus]